MVEYVILGTSHSLQDSPEFEAPLIEVIQDQTIQLVAEEYPFPDICSTARRSATHLGKEYLQIDLLPAECCVLGIYEELQVRKQFLSGKDIRLSHADSVRERMWLEKIENNIDHGRILVVCGYLHQIFLAESIRERGGKVLKKIAYPEDLLDRKPEHILTPTELKEYLRDR